MARSALRSSCSPVVPGTPKVMPMLAVATTSVVPSVTGRRRAVEDPLGQGDDVGMAFDVVDEHGELVTAEAGRGVRAADAAQEHLGDHAEQLVADGVARGCR